MNNVCNGLLIWPHFYPSALKGLEGYCRLNGVRLSAVCPSGVRPSVRRPSVVRPSVRKLFPFRSQISDMTELISFILTNVMTYDKTVMHVE